MHKDDRELLENVGKFALGLGALFLAGKAGGAIYNKGVSRGFGMGWNESRNNLTKSDFGRGLKTGSVSTPQLPQPPLFLE